MPSQNQIERAYELARERYAELGVDTERALRQLTDISISIHCWQGDDLTGFESQGDVLGGGLAVTGNYLGKARTADELRQDFDRAISLIPGRHRISLHSIYAETGDKRVARDELQPSHFASWIDWARERGLGIDFNPTYFGHPHADDGFTLAHHDGAIRRFWIDHGIRCREIAAAIGQSLGTPCITNHWIPDGYKDRPVDRKGPRERLVQSLDHILEVPIDPGHNRDAVESKLFGIGSESYVVGSHEFYLGYAIQRKLLLCLDAGHFHPTEDIADKISSALLWIDELLLHVSRGIRWDSDHVVVLTDELRAIAREIVHGDFLDRVHVGLDFFDASINRVAAWVIGTRATIQALLSALLEPVALLKDYETHGDYTSRLAMQEAIRQLPVGSVWDYYCLQSAVPTDTEWLNEVQAYERQVQRLRT